MAGINRALSRKLSSERTPFTEQVNIRDIINSQSVPCIFLSHKLEDKARVRTIGEYIMDAYGLDIYFDERDEELQTATQDGNSAKVTACIHEGIKFSTHLLCFVSKVTRHSWWVPYEIGYGAALTKRPVATLKFEGKVLLPEYLEITHIMFDKLDLDNYLSAIKQGIYIGEATRNIPFANIQNKAHSYSNTDLELD